MEHGNIIGEEEAIKPRQAQFETREACITCDSEQLRILSSERFHDEPVRAYLDGDAYGENPLPSLRHAIWTFVQCETCGQKFHRDILNYEWQGIHYNQWITRDSIERYYAANERSKFAREFGVGKHAIERMLLIEKLTRRIRSKDPVRVLDFGCGKGEFLSICANSGFQSVGIEISAARAPADRVQYFSDLSETAGAYEPGSFHAITLFEVLQHLNHPLQVLRELSGFAKNGAVLVLETPDCEKVTDIKTRADFALIGPLGHINAFSAASQERIAKEAGFTRISPGVAQCTADAARVYKREVRRLVEPFRKRTTQQFFIKD